MILCDNCRFSDTVIEIRDGNAYEFSSCMYFHQWYKQVREQRQCRDYQTEMDIVDEPVQSLEAYIKKGLVNTIHGISWIAYWMSNCF